MGVPAARAWVRREGTEDRLIQSRSASRSRPSGRSRLLRFRAGHAEQQRHNHADNQAGDQHSLSPLGRFVLPSAYRDQFASRRLDKALARRVYFEGYGRVHLAGTEVLARLVGKTGLGCGGVAAAAKIANLPGCCGRCWVGCRVFRQKEIAAEGQARQNRAGGMARANLTPSSAKE